MKGMTKFAGAARQAIAGAALILCGLSQQGMAGDLGMVVSDTYTLRQANVIETPDHLEAAIWLHNSSDGGKKEKIIARLIQKQSDSAYGHFLMAELNLRRYLAEPLDLSMLKSASELGQQAIELAPDKEYGYLVIAQVLDLMGQSGNAAKILRLAEPAITGHSWRFSFVQAQLAVSNGDDQRAVSYYKQSLSAKDSLDEVIVAPLVAALRKEFTGPELLKELQAIAKHNPHPTLAFAIAESHHELKNYQQAHDTYKSVYVSHPDFYEAKLNDSILLSRHLNDRSGARSLLDSVVSLNPDKVSDELTAACFMQLGEIALQEHRLGEAQSAFTSSVNLAEQKFQTVSEIAKQYRSKNLYKELAKLLDKLNEINPGSGIQHAILGETLSENLARHQEAVAAYSNAIVLDPDRSEFYTGMGLAFYRQQDWNNALRLFSSATKVDPRDAVARYNEACVLAKIGRKQHALDSLRQAIELDPNLRRQAEGDEDFAKIRSSEQFSMIMRAPSPAPFRQETAIDLSH